MGLLAKLAESRQATILINLLMMAATGFVMHYIQTHWPDVVPYLAGGAVGASNLMPSPVLANGSKGS